MLCPLVLLILIFLSFYLPGSVCVSVMLLLDRVGQGRAIFGAECVGLNSAMMFFDFILN